MILLLSHSIIDIDSLLKYIEMGLVSTQRPNICIYIHDNIMLTLINTTIILQL